MEAIYNQDNRVILYVSVCSESLSSTLPFPCSYFCSSPSLQQSLGRSSVSFHMDQPQLFLSHPPSVPLICSHIPYNSDSLTSNFLSNLPLSSPGSSFLVSPQKTSSYWVVSFFLSIIVALEVLISFKGGTQHILHIKVCLQVGGAATCVYGRKEKIVSSLFFCVAPAGAAWSHSRLKPFENIWKMKMVCGCGVRRKRV